MISTLPGEGEFACAGQVTAMRTMSLLWTRAGVAGGNVPDVDVGPAVSRRLR